jgi:hypothetical protein
MVFGVPAIAHPISVSEGVIELGESQTVLELKVLCEDFFLFHRLSADSANRVPSAQLAEAARKHVDFLRRDLYLLDKEGKRLPAEVTLVRTPELPAGGVPLENLMEHAATYRAVWNTSPRPALLSFLHDFGGDNTFVPSVMRVSVRRAGVRTDYLPQLEKKRPLTLGIDWDQPPVPLTAERSRRRAQDRRQEEDAMGLSSYGSVHSFLYLERFTVRHEILVPLMTLNNFLEIPRDDNLTVGIDAQDALKPSIAKLFRARNKIRIDGIPVMPTIDRVDFYGLDFKDFALQAPRRPLNLASARVGIVLTYPALGSFRKLDLNWDLFTPHISSVRSTVFTDDFSRKVLLSIYRPRFEWENPDPGGPPPLDSIEAPSPVPPWSLPWLSLATLTALAATALSCRLWKRRPGGKHVAAMVLLAATATAAWQPVRLSVRNPLASPQAPSEEEALGVTTALLRNIHRAFDYQAEEDIYDALALSADGDLLHQLYLMIHQSRVMQEQGGAVSRIRKVDFIDGHLDSSSTEQTGASAFSCTARWTVTGTVEHWGHVHERTHRYQARFRVHASGGSWKITGFEVFDEQRLNYTTRLRE